MSEMIEIVAKAMFSDDHRESWEQAEEITRKIYLQNARVAILAMRKLTWPMMDAIKREYEILWEKGPFHTPSCEELNRIFISAIDVEMQ